ncbi:cell division protein FtsQ [Pseudomonas sp. HMWF032]|uniref:alginate O-acetyltransferase AlgX-related protein n=1 Tax=Pseudomonas sp. HMWF032 TaxID=2056866 RepID=UPI000D3896B7|nr:cell division protein FtsQ [Pseudomonas sp. HMWF032]PTS82689.1 cell division protein FtsQ [Pseudomonas sp. HMWF032]PTT82322.1 cell division protein FtsQ [Pseudomonas sp. HMWF010]
MSKKDNSLAPVLPSPMMIRLSPLAGLVMFAFLLTGLAFCLWAMFVSGKVDLLPNKVSWDEIRNGEITHRINKELANVPFAKRAADLERAASWLAIGDTGTRVRQGCANWLFLTDELKIHPHAAAHADARAQKVTALHEQLSKRGIHLLVVLVPDKSRIAAQQLCAIERSPLLASRAQDWQHVLQGQGVDVLDLAPTLQPLGSEAFLRTDTHWSEAGAERAAAAVAARIAALGVSPTPAKQFVASVAAPQPRPGDLVRLAGLDWLPERLQPAVEQVAVTQIEEVQGGADDAALGEDDLFGDSQLPNLAVIGTSFSRNSNFIPFLERAVSARVGNFAKDGGEFSGAAKDYFSSPAFKQTPPQVLIWEIPERDLQPPYRDDILLNGPSG